MNPHSGRLSLPNRPTAHPPVPVALSVAWPITSPGSSTQCASLVSGSQGHAISARLYHMPKLITKTPPPPPPATEGASSPLRLNSVWSAACVSGTQNHWCRSGHWLPLPNTCLCASADAAHSWLERESPTKVNGLRPRRATASVTYGRAGNVSSVAARKGRQVRPVCKCRDLEARAAALLDVHVALRELVHTVARSKVLCMAVGFARKHCPVRAVAKGGLIAGRDHACLRTPRAGGITQRTSAGHVRTAQSPASNRPPGRPTRSHTARQQRTLKRRRYTPRDTPFHCSSGLCIYHLRCLAHAQRLARARLRWVPRQCQRLRCRPTRASALPPP